MAKVTDFAAELSERYGLSVGEATDFITLMFDIVREQLDSADKQVKLKGLGTFKVTSVGARASVDVNTGERIMLEGRNKISFTPETLLRDRVNRPFVQFETVVLNDGVDFSEIDREYDESKTKEEPSGKAENDTNEDEREPDTMDGSDVDSAEDFPDDGGLADVAFADVAECASSATENGAAEADDSADAAASDYDNQEQVGSVADEPSCHAAGETQNLAAAAAEESAGDMCAGTDGQNPPCSDAAPDNAAAANMVENDEIICKQRNPRLMYWLTAASFVMLVCIGVGMYFIYRQMDAKNQAIEQLQSKLAVHAANLSALSNDAKRAPAPVGKAVNEASPTSQARPKADTVKAKPTEQPTSIVETAVTDYNYDARIRTGAYVIVGTDRTVTLKAGQTLPSVSKTYLGPGMECYVEVYNNCKDAKPGDKLKIPKLKLKKLRQ